MLAAQAILSILKGNAAMDPSVLEELFDALSESHVIDPQRVRLESLRLYLNSHPSLKLEGALLLWSKGQVSLAKASELAGLTVPEFKEILDVRGITRETEGKTAEDMDATLKRLLP